MNRLIRIEIHEDDAAYLLQILRHTRDNVLPVIAINDDTLKKATECIDEFYNKMKHKFSEALEKGNYTQLPPDPTQ